MEALLHVLVHGWAEGLMTWREEEGRGKEEQEEEGRIERKMKEEEEDGYKNKKRKQDGIAVIRGREECDY